MRSIIGYVTAALLLFGPGSYASAAEKVDKDFDQWRVACDDKDGAKRTCVIISALVNQKKSIVMSWTITQDKEKKGNKIIIRTLTGVLIADGIAVRFGQSDPVRVPYKICMPQFCLAEIPFSDTWLKTFRASKGFSVSITAANGKEIKYDLSLNKFSAAFDFYSSEATATN